MIPRFSKKRSNSDRESLWSVFSRHCKHWYSLLSTPLSPKSSSDLFFSSSELDKASTALLLHQRWESGLPALSKEPEKVELGGVRVVQPARGQEHLQAHRLAYARLGRARPHQVNNHWCNFSWKAQFDQFFILNLSKGAAGWRITAWWLSASWTNCAFSSCGDATGSQ